MEGVLGLFRERPESRSNIFQTIRARVCGLATYLGCGGEAEDIAHETLVVIFEKYSDKNPEELLRISTKICVNLVLNRRRRADRRGPELSDSIEDVSADPERLAAKAELVRALMNAIEKSSPIDKALLRLDLQDFDTDEICSQLGINRETLYSRRNRCYKHLRAILRSIQ
jgi:RNA polymerase sigma factor (sigma-70 family)